MNDVSNRQFFSGDTLQQALVQAANHFGITPEEIAYRTIEKKHGFLKNRPRVVIEVDASAPRRERPAPLPAAPAPVAPPPPPPRAEPREAAPVEAPPRSEAPSEAPFEAPSGAERLEARPEDRSADRGPRPERRERGEDRPPGRGPGGDRGPGRGPDRGSDRGPGRGPDRGPSRGGDRGPGRGADRGPGRGPDRGPGRGPDRGPGRGPDRGRGRDDRGPERGPGRGPARGPGLDRGPARGGNGPGRDNRMRDDRGRDDDRGNRSPRGGERPAVSGNSIGGNFSRGGEERRGDRERPAGFVPRPRLEADEPADLNLPEENGLVKLPEMLRRPSERYPEAAGAQAEAAAKGTALLLRIAGLDLAPRVLQGEERLEIDLSGDDVDWCFSDDGEVVLAFEHLLPRIIRSLSGEAPLVRVDCDNFQEIREERLRSLAQRIADEVRRRGRPRILEPMNPADRRIVHMTLADDPGVITESTGEGYFKRVTIRPAPGATA